MLKLRNDPSYHILVQGKLAAAVGLNAGLAQGTGSKFDPAMLSRTLASPLFAKYVDLVHHLESLPQCFARWSEGCPCHDRVVRLLQSDDSDRRTHTALLRDCLVTHYGRQTKFCPMAGQRAPELVCGALEDIFEDTWQVNIAAWSTSDVDGLRPLRPEESECLANDLAAARTHLLIELQAKMDWRLRLPWSLLGLAHHDEIKARRCAIDVADQFRRDPRRQTCVSMFSRCSRRCRAIVVAGGMKAPRADGGLAPPPRAPPLLPFPLVPGTLGPVTRGPCRTTSPPPHPHPSPTPPLLWHLSATPLCYST